MKDQGHMKSKMTLISTRGMGTETEGNVRKASENGGRKLMPSYSLRQCLQSSTPCKALTNWSIQSNQLKSHSTGRTSLHHFILIQEISGNMERDIQLCYLQCKLQEKHGATETQVRREKEVQFSIQATVVHALSIFHVE